ncbi:short transient receptor potential channel 4-like [Glandiceps talaboti]
MQRIVIKPHGEDEFLRLVEEGEVKQVKLLLQAGNIDINCVGVRRRKPVTALQIAANNNNFQMVKLLHNNGAQPLTHPITPNGGEDDVWDDDSRYNMYNAICSPAYLCILHENPPDAAIDISESLLDLSEAREIADTSKDIYLDLSRRTREFLVEILDCCDTSEEVMTLLNGRDQSEGEESYKQDKLSLLRKAIDSDEKEFVSHRKCQKVVKKEWLRGQPKWHTRNGFHWTTLYAFYGFLVYLLAMPILSLIYIVAPCSPVAKVLDTPKSKFLTHMSSHFLFISFVMIEDIALHTEPTIDIHVVKEIVLCVILVYLASYGWLLVVQCYMHGMKKFFTDIKSLVDVFNVVILIMDVSLHLIDEITQNVNILVKIFFDTGTSIALVLVCLRFLRYFYLSTFIGQLLLLLVAMRTEIYRFMVIYIYVVGAFTFGFYYLYYELADNGYFSSFSSIVQSLLMVVFGSDPTSGLSVEVTYNSTSGEVHDVSVVVEVIGVTLYVLFGTVIIMVLLNTSIALMSDTYSKLKENIDVEWKFVRTKIWLEYMDCPVVPPPFNIIIPSGACIKYIYHRICSKKTAKVGQENQTNNPNGVEDDDPVIVRNIQYDKLVKTLLHRYTLLKGLVKDDDDGLFNLKAEHKNQHLSQTNTYSNTTADRDTEKSIEYI